MKIGLKLVEIYGITFWDIFLKNWFLNQFVRIIITGDRQEKKNDLLVDFAWVYWAFICFSNSNECTMMSLLCLDYKKSCLCQKQRFGGGRPPQILNHTHEKNRLFFFSVWPLTSNLVQIPNKLKSFKILLNLTVFLILIFNCSKGYAMPPSDHFHQKTFLSNTFY